MSKLVKGVETIEQSPTDEPARTLDHQEQLQIAKHIVQALNAAGVDCDLAEAASAH